MQAPRTLAAVFFSAALILTSGLALADGDHGKGHPHGSQAGASSPNSSATGPMNKAGPNGAGPGGSAHGPDSHGTNPMGGPGANAAPGNSEHGAPATQNGGDRDQSHVSSSQFRGDVDTISQNKVTIKINGGASTRTFDVDDKMAAKIKARENEKGLVFFSTDGQHITSMSRVNETAHAKVVSISGITVTIQLQDGETRLLGMDQKSQKRLHLRAGSDIDVTTRDDNSARVVSEEQLKKHWSDKFSGARRVAKAGVDVDTRKAHKKGKAKSDRDTRVADNDVIKSKCGESGKGRNGRAFANQMAKDARNDASGHNPPGLPHACVNPAGHTRGFCKSKSNDVDCSGSGATDNDVASTDTDHSQQHVAKSKCGESAKSASAQGRAFANQMAKDARNDASGHNPPGLPHECVNPAGHTRGWCKSRSESSDVDCSGSGSTDTEVAATDTENGAHVAKNKCGESAKSGKGHGRAFANQMALDARNDASGHNPPGLPHECVNPAGHTRGWCKTRSETADVECSASTGTEVASVPNTVSGVTNAPNTAPGNSSGTLGAGSSPTIVSPGHGGPATRPGGPVTRPGGPLVIPAPGVVPIGGNSPVIGPTSIAAAPVPVVASKAKHPTRVLGASTGPASIALVRPLANTPCVWHKTAVLGASITPRRIAYVPHRAYTGYVPHRPHVRTACH